MITDRSRSAVHKAGSLVMAIIAFAGMAIAGDNCTKQLPDLIDRSLTIVAGKVIKIGPSPGFWSEVLPAIQDVQYDVLKVYKGGIGGGSLGQDNASGPQITVSYKIIKGSRLVQKHPPGLSPQIFAPGKELVLFLQTPKQNVEDECAAQVRTPALEQQVEEIITKPTKTQ